MATTGVPISVQLYSLREEAANDFEAVLRTIGEIGFSGVEFAGFNGLTPQRCRAILDDSAMVASSAHIGDASPDALAATLDDLAVVGVSTVMLAFLPDTAFADLAAVQRSAELINTANETASARGMRLGYHNHWWEFERTIDGRSAYEVLYSLLDPRVLAELDIYWATVGGADPVAVAGMLGDRLRYAHVKDGPADDPKSPMVAVGSGSVDLPRALGAMPALEWHVVELDRCATDMTDAIRGSYAHLTSTGISRGRK